METKISTILLLIAFLSLGCSRYDDQVINCDQVIENAKESTLDENKESKSLIPLEQIDIQIILDWESCSDLDLYVQDPTGEWIWHKHRTSRSNGILDKDDRNGTEFEKIEWPLKKASLGYYNIYIKHNGGQNASFQVQIKAFGNTKQISGTIKSNQKLYITTFSESNLEANLQAENLQIPELRKN